MTRDWWKIVAAPGVDRCERAGCWGGERGTYPTPGCFWQRVRKRLKIKELSF